MSIDLPVELLTASSGSAGDVVASRNQHGPYLRARTTPTDPASAPQIVVRNALTECVIAWNATLTDIERRGWDAFALSVRTRTALGRSTNAGGLGMYIRANVPRIQASVGTPPRVDQAPTQQSAPHMEPITRVVLNVVDDTLLAFVPPYQPWLNKVHGAILFYASRPQPLTVNFFRGPYRYAGKLPGQPLGPSVTPFTFSAPFAAAPGERVFVRARQTKADARLGPSIFLQADHVPQVAPTPISATMHTGTPRTISMVFSEIIRPEPHSTANWTVQYGGRWWTVLLVADDWDPTDALTLYLNRGAVAPPGKWITFSPPPVDVYGMLTGIPVAGFSLPLAP